MACARRVTPAQSDELQIQTRGEGNVEAISCTYGSRGPYLRSNDYIIPMNRKIVDGFVAAGGEESIPLAILSVKKECLDEAFDEIQKKYGTIDKYFFLETGHKC